MTGQLRAWAATACKTNAKFLPDYGFCFENNTLANESHHYHRVNVLEYR